MTLARHPSETAERASVRLLAYAMRYAERLEFGRGVSAPDEPSLSLTSDDGRILEWIEVGQPSASRMLKAARRSVEARLFVHGRGHERWWSAEREAMAKITNLEVLCFDDDFVASVAEALDRSVRWSLTQSEGTMFLAIDRAPHELSLETTPELLQRLQSE